MGVRTRESYDLATMRSLKRELEQAMKDLDQLVELYERNELTVVEIRNSSWLAKGRKGWGRFLSAAAEDVRYAISERLYKAEREAMVAKARMG